MSTLTSAEQAAATAISFMNQQGEKREREEPDSADAAGGVRPPKMVRGENGAPRRAGAVYRELKPYPFFYYRDHSTEVDEDPLSPLTPVGRVPTFPAKMHAILTRDEFKDIVAWLPHGRSWRVLKPREFEVKVIPMFFEHAKFSSFVRQANGWGFRRITQGKDRNSYYHEKFLRGLPHLCKTMKRPGVNEKKTADPEHEPDLYEVSKLYPVPEKADDDSVMLHCTINGGPKARMPIFGATMASYSASAMPSVMENMAAAKMPAMVTNQNVQQPVQQPFQQPIQQPTAEPAKVSPVASVPKPQVAVNPATMPNFFAMPAPVQTGAAAAPAMDPASFAAFMQTMPGMNTAAASQFAAGFAAATAFSQHHFSAVFSQIQQQQEQQKQSS